MSAHYMLNSVQIQNVTTAKRHNIQMPKPNRNDCKSGKQTNLLVQGNDCKSGKQTNLLVQGATSALQKSQITLDT